MWKGVEDGTGSAGCSETENDNDENVLELLNMDSSKDEFGSKVMEDDENEECKETESRFKKQCRRPKEYRDGMMRTFAGDAELPDDVLLVNAVGISQIRDFIKKQDLKI